VHDDARDTALIGMPLLRQSMAAQPGQSHDPGAFARRVRVARLRPQPRTDALLTMTPRRSGTMCRRNGTGGTGRGGLVVTSEDPGSTVVGHVNDARIDAEPDRFDQHVMPPSRGRPVV